MAAKGIDPDHFRTAAIVVVLVLMLAVLAYGGVQVIQLTGIDPASAQDPTRIDSCTMITNPGRYVLTTDIESSEADRCIQIKSDDVVLDGGDHAINGVGAFGSAGVRVEGTANVTVRNANVTSWDDGIRYISVKNGTIENTTTAHNRVGHTLLNSSGTTVSNNIATRNAVYGISLQEASSNNTVTNNTATSNSMFGIHLVRAGVTNNTIASNTASSNEYGIVLIGATGNAVIDNNATANRIAGIWLSEADSNHLANNTVSNRFYGIYLGDQSSRNTVSSNTASENAVGIRLIHSERNTISNNFGIGNSAQGILLLASDDNTIRDNAVSGRAGDVVLARSDRVRRSNNTAIGALGTLREYDLVKYSQTDPSARIMLSRSPLSLSDSVGVQPRQHFR